MSAVAWTDIQGRSVYAKLYKDKYAGVEYDVNNESEDDTNHINTAVLDWLTEGQDSLRCEYNLLLSFQDLTEGWTVPTFEKINKTLRGVLKEYIRGRGLYLPSNLRKDQ